MNDERAAKAVDKKIGQRVRSRRLEINMSQERLADMLGVTFQQVQKYEKGVNRIAASRLHDIAAALDMPVSRFFEGLSGGRSGGVAESAREFADDVLSTPEGAQLIALFASIKSVKVRRRVVELVKALTEESEGKR
ncbi:MAG: helix-turn-helix domain-containing protein [Hyphomonadaceae bacterium]